jgi:hypothetical protein
LLDGWWAFDPLNYVESVYDPLNFIFIMLLSCLIRIPWTFYLLMDPLNFICTHASFMLNGSLELFTENLSLWIPWTK